MKCSAIKKSVAHNF